MGARKLLLSLRKETAVGHGCKETASSAIHWGSSAAVAMGARKLPPLLPPPPQAAQLAEALKEAKAAEKEARAEVAPVLREGKAAVAELAAAEAAADKAVRTTDCPSTFHPAPAPRAKPWVPNPLSFP